MGFDSGTGIDPEQLRQAIQETRTERIIERIIEVPKFKTVVVEKPNFIKKDVTVDRIIYKDKIVEVPVYQQITIERPVYVDKIINVDKVNIREVEKIVEVPKYVEKIVEVPKYVTKEILVEKVKVIPVEKRVEIPFNVDVPKMKRVEVPFNVDVPKIVHREIIVDKPKFRETIIEIIRPHYVCQNCGKEV